MGAEPVHVERFARVFTKGPEELPPNSDSYHHPERGYYFKLHLGGVASDDVVPIVKSAQRRFEVELVERIRQKGVMKERVYVESPEQVPEGYRVEEGPQGGIYYETQPRGVRGPETAAAEHPVAVIHWDDVELGDEIVYERVDGTETFAEIVDIEEVGGREEPDIVHVDVDGEIERARPGTYSVDNGIERMVKAGDPWVPYTGPRGGQGWHNRQTGEIRYQEQHPEIADGPDEDPELDFDPAEPPEGGYGRGWTGPPEDPVDLDPGQAVEYFDDGYGYAEVVDASDEVVEVESEGGERAHIAPDQITATELGEWDPTDVPDIEFAEPPPESFANAVSAMIEEDPEMGAFLTEHDPQEFDDYNLVLAEGGTAGAAVSPDGDIQNVFAREEAESGAGRAALAAAIEAGGITLDCYDGYLRELYVEFGFRETGRMEFNPDYAPEGFDFDKYGHPDVVFMHLDPEAPVELEDTYYEPEQWGDAKQDSRRAANPRRDGGSEGGGLGGGERGTDSEAGEADGRPISASEGTVTSDTGGVHSARYSPEDEEEVEADLGQPNRERIENADHRSVDDCLWCKNTQRLVKPDMFGPDDDVCPFCHDEVNVVDVDTHGDHAVDKSDRRGDFICPYIGASFKASSVADGDRCPLCGDPVVIRNGDR